MNQKIVTCFFLAASVLLAGCAADTTNEEGLNDDEFLVGDEVEDGEVGETSSALACGTSVSYDCGQAGKSTRACWGRVRYRNCGKKTAYVKANVFLGLTQCKAVKSNKTVELAYFMMPPSFYIATQTCGGGGFGGGGGGGW